MEAERFGQKGTEHQGASTGNDSTSRTRQVFPFCSHGRSCGYTWVNESPVLPGLSDGGTNWAFIKPCRTPEGTPGLRVKPLRESHEATAWIKTRDRWRDRQACPFAKRSSDSSSAASIPCGSEDGIERVEEAALPVDQRPVAIEGEGVEAAEVDLAYRILFGLEGWELRPSVSCRRR
jgi:hypothetical protein